MMMINSSFVVYRRKNNLEKDKLTEAQIISSDKSARNREEFFFCAAIKTNQIEICKNNDDRQSQIK